MEGKISITITNVQHGDVLSYSLPLIEGDVISNCDVIEIHVWNDANPAASVSWPVKDDRFKALVQLLPGDNVIKLRCDDVIETFLLVYKPLARKHYVRPIYIVCSDDDGRFQAPPNVDNSVENAQKRIILGAKLIQTFTAEKLHEHGLGRRTFQLECNRFGEPVCHVYKSSLTLQKALAMAGNDLWTHFAKEFMNSKMLDRDTCKWYAFMSFTRYCPPAGGFIPKTHSEILQATRGHAALGTYIIYTRYGQPPARGPNPACSMFRSGRGLLLKLQSGPESYFAIKYIAPTSYPMC